MIHPLSEAKNAAKRNKVVILPGHLAGRSFLPSGFAFSLTFQRALAPRVTDDGKTWQSCAMPGHPGQSNKPGRRKLRLKKKKKTQFLDKQKIMPLIIMIKTDMAQRVKLR